jgi:general secretion pathway protein G
MRQRIHTIRANENGFTLIELLITVVILGVLAGVVVFAVGQFNTDGVDAACKADKKNVEIADEALFAKTAAHAASTAELVTAGYLREAPPAGPPGKYSVTIAAGVITASC